MVRKATRPKPASSPLRLAIACQGGGSHTAFTGGVLDALLEQVGDDGLLHRGELSYRIVAMSGTSGGALCAYLFWLELMARRRPARSALRDFWDLTAARPWPSEPMPGMDLVSNWISLWLARSQDYLLMPGGRPTALSKIAQDRLRADLSRFDHLLPVAASTGDEPWLVIGAANLLDAHSRPFVFSPACLPSLDALLASTAVPPLFDPVQVGPDPRQLYWDGLLSQNPPLREFFTGRTRDEKPDVIWVVRINPVRVDCAPDSPNARRDRYNELIGNLALAHELMNLDDYNQIVSDLAKLPSLPPGGRLASIKAVIPEEILFEEATDPAYDYASKLDRSPAFIDTLFEAGREAASRFLAHDPRPVPCPPRAEICPAFARR